MLKQIDKNPASKPSKILFAHHDDQILSMISEMFELQTGQGKLVLEFANSGQQILQKLSNSAFDVIVIDEGLAEINIPKVFHELILKFPRSKIIFLMGVIDDEIIKANGLSIIQYYKKPFSHKNLISTIMNTIKNPFLEIGNLSIADLLLSLSIINNKTGLCILNNKNGASGEVFINLKRITFASVENGDVLLNGLNALEEVLTWETFESCYSDAIFPEATNVLSSSIEVLYEHLQTKKHAVIINNSFDPEHNSGLCQPISAEAQQRLRHLLAYIPKKIEDRFVMNAFCNSQFRFLSQLKNPKFNESLYRIGDSILDGFEQGKIALQDEYANFYTCKLPCSHLMSLHKMNEDIWYFTILDNDKHQSDDLIDLVSSFSDVISFILNSSTNRYEYLD
jgi:hypothetical protein